MFMIVVIFAKFIVINKATCVIKNGRNSET